MKEAIFFFVLGTIAMNLFVIRHYIQKIWFKVRDK